MTNTVTKRGRREIFDKPALIKRVLREIRSGEQAESSACATRYLAHRLAEQGLVDFVTVRSTGRGRPRKVAQVTRAGELYLSQL
jgi:hypothetical protein